MGGEEVASYFSQVYFHSSEYNEPIGISNFTFRYLISIFYSLHNPNIQIYSSWYSRVVIYLGTHIAWFRVP